MIFLSKDGKCLWDGSGDALQADDDGIIGISTNGMAHAFARLRDIYAIASARLHLRSAASVATPDCDCGAPIC